MLTGEAELRAGPLRERAWGIFLGVLLLLTLTAALVSARTIPFMLASVAVGFLARAIAAGWTKDLVANPNELHLALAAFLGWSLVSSLWSQDAAHALMKLAVAVAVIAGTTAIVVTGRNENRANLLHIGEGLWIGLLAGLAYFAVELVTGQAIKIWTYNLLNFSPSDLPHRDYFRWRGEEIVYISAVDLTRNASSITLVMWGTMLAALGTLPRRAGQVVAGVIFVTSLAVVAMSSQETSKLSIVVGTIAFVTALASRIWARRLLLTAWVIVCLAIVPMVIGLYRLDLHNAAFLPPSGQHRIIIWNYTAEQALRSPLIGIGVHSTHVLGPSIAPKLRSAPGEKLPRTLSRHAHNIYLQTWFELGVVGAILLAFLGAAALRLIGRLDERVQPYAIATFACAAVVGAASYGMWQIWYMAMFGMAFAVLALGAHIYCSRNYPDHALAGGSLDGCQSKRRSADV